MLPFAICFSVCDQPYLRSVSIKGLIDGYRKSKKGIGCFYSKGKRGNLVIFSDKYIKELRLLEGDVGGKKVLMKHLDDVYMQ